MKKSLEDGTDYDEIHAKNPLALDIVEPIITGIEHWLDVKIQDHRGEA